MTYIRHAEKCAAPLERGMRSHGVYTPWERAEDPIECEWGMCGGAALVLLCGVRGQRFGEVSLGEAAFLP